MSASGSAGIAVGGHPPAEVRPGDAGYPARLHDLPEPPAALWVKGTLGAFERTHAPTIAIVGTRKPVAEAEAFAAELAGAVASAGGIVVSGGARGIDAAAHRGALAKGGPTWVVAPTGHAHVYPEEHGPLYDAVTAGGGALVWPFAPDTVARRHNFFLRNGVLVALADAVVVVQAGIPSGALNAASWGRKLSRPLWVVVGAPWMREFRGCRAEIDRGGARPLTSIATLLGFVGLGAPGKSTGARGEQTETKELAARSRALSAEEKSVLEATSHTPRHADEIGSRTGLPARTLSTLLLTLALENVVVEGPDGFFRRGSPL
jgi:DNA processing protein